MQGTGNSTLHNCSQLNISRTLPCELNLAYLSNSSLENHNIKYSGSNTFSSFTSKTVYELDTMQTSSFKSAIDIFSPFLDVTGPYANCLCLTNLYFFKSVPIIFAIEGINFFVILTPKRFETLNLYFLHQ